MANKHRDLRARWASTPLEVTFSSGANPAYFSMLALRGRTLRNLQWTASWVMWMWCNRHEHYRTVGFIVTVPDEPQTAEEQSRIRRGLPRKAPPSAQPDGTPQKRKKGAVKRGKFSTRRANGVSKEQRQAKYNKNKDRNKAAARASSAAAQ